MTDSDSSYFRFRAVPGWEDPPEPVRVGPGEWPETEAALAVVNRDLAAALPGQDALVLMSTPGWEPTAGSEAPGDQLYVALPDGRWQGGAVNSWSPGEDGAREPDDPAMVLALVAEAAQETVMELLRRVWPVCPAHGIGTHPRPPGTTKDWYQGEPAPVGPPVWWCRGGRGDPCHDVSPVGELAAVLTGGRRRARREGGRGRGGRR
ncbi:hypothetical protein JNUCC64_21520 [Streptomyces sp. JNUCC 64]